MQTVTRRAISAAQPASRRPCVVVSAKVSLAGLVQDLSNLQLKANPTDVRVGDSVKLGIKVQEGNGKTRTQKLDGVIIAQHGGGTSKTLTFRRVFQGIGVELVVPVHAPVLDSMELVRRGRVRRSKLFFLRERIGKSARLVEVVGAKGTLAAKQKEKAVAVAKAAAAKAEADASAAAAAASVAADAPAAQ